MHSPKIPSLVRIVQVDYTASMAFLYPCVFWGMYLVLTIFGVLPDLMRGVTITQAAGGSFFFIIALVSTVLGLMVLAWRFLKIRSLFEHGIEVKGKIDRVGFFRDRGRVEYSYTYQGKALSAGIAVMKVKRTKALIPSSPAMIVVDQGNPRKALIRDLYL